MRLRRSCLAVPGSSPKMLEKARALPADEVFLDLEDAVAPSEKDGRDAADIVDALQQDDWTGKTTSSGSTASPRGGASAT